MAFQNFNVGSGLGNHDGDDPFSTFTKIKAMLQELYAGSSSVAGYLAVTITAASTNNYNPGGGFPTSIGWLDINPSTNDVTLTGLLAGTDGQQLTIRNSGTTYNILLSTGGNGQGDSGSTAANRFTGQGDAGIAPGGVTRITYRLLPTPTWATG
jgi:hypothetical protein